MATVLEAYKKRKRNPKIYGLHMFAHPGCPIAPSGSFRDNIRVFLQQCSEPEAYKVDGMPVWCTFLVHEGKGFLVPLYTIEESVKHSLTPFCDHCRCTGWSHHFVSKRKYHMIIPVDDDWNKPLDEGVFDVQTHLLHGLIHCNGFGHLISINGIEGGSKYLCGRQIMDLWDRICTNLHCRKITVEDVSKKRSMDLRLLHGVAYGHPWFGRWGYRFCNGSFGVTQLRYEKAVEILSLLELDKITQDFTTAALYRDFKGIICYYRNLSETKLVTIRDLLRFMLTLKSRVPFQRKSTNLTSTASSSACSKAVTKSFAKEKPVRRSRFSDVAVKGSRWRVQRLENVADVVVDALREKKLTNKGVNCVMTGQEVRDAARLQIGDTGLIDYVLKSMKNVVVGGLIVRQNVNKSTKISEFTIEELASDSRVDSPEQETEVLHKPVPPPAFSPGIDVYKDVHFLYRNVLMGYRSSERIGLAAQTVLDTKFFVKEWPFKDEDDELLRFICHVVSKFRDLESDFYRREFSHGELIVLPLHSTHGDLKAEVENAMRDTYCATENFVVTDIEGLEGTEDSEVLFGLVESGSEIRERICKNLRARKITVEDFSKRRSMDLRFLQGLNFSGSFAKEKPVNCRKFSNVGANLDSHWPVGRLEYVEGAVVDAMKEKKLINKGFNYGMMTRQEARDAACLQIGDVLKLMGNNVVVGGLLVHRNVNKSTRISEFRIEELDSHADSPEIVHKPIPSPPFVPRIDVYKDLDLYRTAQMDCSVLLVLQPLDQPFFEVINMGTGFYTTYEYPGIESWMIIGSDNNSGVLMRGARDLIIVNLVEGQIQYLPSLGFDLESASIGCFRRQLVYIVNVNAECACLLKHTSGAWVRYELDGLELGSPAECVVLSTENRCYWLHQRTVHCWYTDHVEWIIRLDTHGEYFYFFPDAQSIVTTGGRVLLICCSIIEGAKVFDVTDEEAFALKTGVFGTCYMTQQSGGRLFELDADDISVYAANPLNPRTDDVFFFNYEHGEAWKACSFLQDWVGGPCCPCGFSFIFL